MEYQSAIQACKRIDCLQVLSDRNPIAEYLLATGYAALKELDFWMNVDQHHTPYTMNYGGHTPIAWSRKPYDQCILMSSRTTDGAVIPNAGEAIRNTIADHLLFSLADEQPADGDAASSLRCFEDNLRANAAMLPRPLPFGYSYRALNVFSLRFPRKKLLRFEGACFLEAYLHLKDENGQPAAGDALLNTVQPLQRAQGIIGNVRDLHANFARECSLPNWGAGAAPGGVIPVLQQMQPRPHDRENTKPIPWLDSIARPAAAQSAEYYLTGAWKRFEAFCAPVLGNPELGPFALRDYLDHPDKGLIKEMENQVAVWMNMGRKFKMDLSALKQACTASWPDFEHPPLLRRTRALETYLQNLNNYFNGLRKAVFMEAHAKAARKLLLRMREYLAQSLKPLCEDLVELYKAFRRNDEDQAFPGADLADVERLKPRIEQLLAAGHEDHRIPQRFLEALGRETLKTVPNKDTDTSGVTFVYRREGWQAVEALMMETLRDCFGSINSLSLDELLHLTIGEDSALQQQYLSDITRAVTTDLQPLFAQAPGAAGEAHAAYTCLSVPENAPEHLAHIRSHTAGRPVQMKASALDDRISCVTVWDGLPLYRYALMARMREAYYLNLHYPYNAGAIHLVGIKSNATDYTNHWRYLPDPTPVGCFPGQDKYGSEKHWDRLCKLTGRAVECGMLEVDVSDFHPVFRLHVFQADVPLSSDEITRQVESILSRTNGDGVPLTPAQKLDLLNACERQAAVTVLAPGCSPECMAPGLKLLGQDTNPWSFEVMMDPSRRAEAKENHRRLSEALATVLLQQQPRLVLALETQLEGWEQLAKARKDLAP